jgi:NAD(P)-dependent dehydrogenase (short-subunit alcohol dehydrogenase family)
MASAAADLSGKAAIVTGATSGIGNGIAAALAEAGADVAVVGRDRERLQAIAERVEGAGRRAAPIVADLTEEDAGARVVEQALAAFGRLDVLVNAAGTFELAPFEDSLPLLDRQWAANVRGPFMLTQAAMGPLREQRGTVLFMSSIGGRIGFPTASGYCAVKGAIENLVRAIALEEAGNGVTVNAIAPGNVRTPMNAHLFENPEYEQMMLAATPNGRIAEVDDIVPAALFLVSEPARYITGACVVIDGGWTAQ